MAIHSNIFISYAHRDRAYLNQLRVHLTGIFPSDAISIWDDLQIRGGENWQEEINKHISAAHVILLLISADFLASDFCYSRQMEEIMEAHKSGKIIVIPILVHSTIWEDTLFGQLLPLPKDRIPISSRKNKDETLKYITQDIKHIIDMKQILAAKKIQTVEASPPDKSGCYPPLSSRTMAYHHISCKRSI